jgi:hypothetical protein
LAGLISQLQSQVWVSGAEIKLIIIAIDVQCADGLVLFQPAALAAATY